MGRRRAASALEPEADMARKFLYVCAGLFLLGLTDHSGARNAGAQPVRGAVSGVNRLVDFITDPNIFSAFTAGGDCYVATNGDAMAWRTGANIFASSGYQASGDEVVAATTRYFPSGLLAITAQGHFYFSADDCGSWTHVTWTIFNDSGRIGFTGPAPSGETIVGLAPPHGSGQDMAVLAASGNVYDDDWGWTIPAANILGGPTPAQKSTWGEVKARYR
jgi:hypothetical protein